MALIDTTATLRQLRVSPRKVRLMVDLIRGLSAESALHQLEFSKKAASRPMLKLVRSAMANAKHNNGVTNPEKAIIATAFVDGGQTLHRFTPRAFGRATPIRKRTSHVTIVLRGEGAAKDGQKGEKEEAVVEGVIETKEVQKTKKQESKKTTAKKVAPKEKKKVAVKKKA